jgi:hypothetical protein
LSLIEQDPEVLQERTVLARLSGHLLEHLYRGRRPQDAFGGVRRHLRRFGVLSVGEQHLELVDEEILRPGKVVPRRYPQRQVRIVQDLVDVPDDVVLVDAHRQHLSPPVHPDYTPGGLVGGRHEDGLARDAVHVDADGALDVVHVYVAVLGDQVDDVVLGRDLHRHREVVLGLGGEEHVDRLLGEGLVAGGALAHLDYVQLAALRRPHGEAEQRRRFGVTLHLEGGEGGGVSLDRLGTLSFDGVELHGPHDAGLLGADSHQQQPVLFGVGAVIDDLTAVQG